MSGDRLAIDGTEGRAPGARRAAAAAVLGVALLAATTIPGTPVGLGLTLVAFGAAGAVLLARPALDHTGLLLTGLALGLAAMPILRDAEWVVALDLLGAVGLATAVATRAVRWREVFAAPVAVALAVGGAVGFVIAPWAGRFRPGRVAPALRGAVIALAMLLVFGALFVSADRAFAQLAEDLLPDWDLGLMPARVAVFLVVLLGTAALARTAVGSVVRADGVPVEDRRGVGRTEWTIALTVLDLLFAAFVAVQVAVLFGGRDHVLSTAGLTYAEYARQGFFQLLVVGALTLGVVAGAVRWAGHRDAAGDRRLQLLLGVLCVLTLVVLASAFRRLSLYEAVFGYTQLRISVHATIIWMAALFVLVLVAGVRMRASWLPRTVLGLTAAGLVTFSLLNPDGMVAERNVRRFEATGLLDLEYVRTLGADAVPALAELPPGVRCWALAPTAARLSREDPLLGWNIARDRARAALDGRVGVLAPECDIDQVARLPGVTWGTL